MQQPRTVNAPDTVALLQWLGSDQAVPIADGYQGAAYLYQQAGQRWIIKTIPVSRFFSWLYLYMLRREYAVYLQLIGFEGVPICFGLLNGRYLILEYIEGESLRSAVFANEAARERFFERLLQLLQALHARNIVHSDLKKKDNILVTSYEYPCLIDFGAAIIKRSEWHVVNAYLFYLGRRFDLNAWVKHKYRRVYANVSDVDRQYLQRTYIERFTHQLRDPKPWLIPMCRWLLSGFVLGLIAVYLYRN